MSWNKWLVAAAALAAAPVAAETTEAQLQALVQAQQAQIDELKARLTALEGASQATSKRVGIAEEQLDAATTALERRSEDNQGRTQIGGYGELHFSQLDGQQGGDDTKEADFHRFVLFVGHEFSQRLRFFSEVELEHAVASSEDVGEVELEQAYAEYQLDDVWRARAGLMLVPVGLLNETHEPPTFFGVERNDVESIIIPSTWREAGVGASADFGHGLALDFMVHSGFRMPTDGDDAFRIRDGRQEAAEAIARNPAYTARLRYHADPGLDLSFAVQYQDDASQSGHDGVDEAWLGVAAASWQYQGFALRGVYARWDFSGDAIEAANADRQRGWYVEPSYRFDVNTGELGFYARYEDIEAARSVDRFDQWELGVNYWLVPEVVVKLDWRRRDHRAEGVSDFRGFDVGFGYQF